jgi:hypothetical protein
MRENTNFERGSFDMSKNYGRMVYIYNYDLNALLAKKFSNEIENTILVML